MTKLAEAIEFSPVTKQQIRDYCDASGDNNRIHWDSDFAKEAGLPDVIAHGMLSMGLLGEALARWGISIEQIQSYESKFKEMVNPGDQLSAFCLNSEEAISSKTLRLSLKNQAGQEVCSGTVKLLP